MLTRVLPFHGSRVQKNYEVKRAWARAVPGWVTSWEVLGLAWDSASKASGLTKFTTKVADFGLSQLAPIPNTQGIVNDKFSTVIKGTPGYVYPEYFNTHVYTDKSDVYSLGVVFLELLTSRQPSRLGRNVVQEVSASYESGDILSIIDGRMRSYPRECVAKFASLALR